MEYVTHTIYFRTVNSDGCLTLTVAALPTHIEAYSREVWDGLQKGGFEMMNTRP